ncbi:hypothetical protein DAPPUDRAFT_233023 [Daphnia pulex]|uniref:Protein sleepless n=1 Tax=Daphnia pulex TaxID=6669 RepID=E9FSZ4_DAPPU|nr:hypothetical protein DAPPUDRAFT_233023 [Daphnia pulex]|eukprot:EFX89278.1 hypothetical protein DAPPUDRAFT_233023 [Daphnia pulex]
MKNLVAVLVVSLSLATLGDGLSCYVCTSSDVDWNEECETGNRTLMPSIECPDSYDGRTAYCIYKKTQWKTISGANSVLRSCADEPLYRNGQQDLEGGNLTVWYQSCTMDLCNNAPSLPKVGFKLSG